jgi:predicted enzyme related to lactoylglutathione lyase
MNYEIYPWITTERRNIKGGGGNNPQITEARYSIRRLDYAEALDIYENVFEQTGSVSSGYNTAVLFQANERFTDALGLLKNLNDRISESGKNSPSYIKKEITKVEGYINGFAVLEDYELP